MMLRFAAVCSLLVQGFAATDSETPTNNKCEHGLTNEAGQCQIQQDHMMLQTKNKVHIVSDKSKTSTATAATTKDLPVIGYPNTAEMKAAGLWCAVETPPPEWNLKACPFTEGISTAKTSVKVLTYNLFWWNLFNQHGGGSRSAGKLIARTEGDDGYDLMGFQECDDRWRVMNDAIAEGLTGEWEAVDGGHALALAYRKDRWEVLDSGATEVGEDSYPQWYGKRSAVWVRLRHKADGTTVFYINHHGPLPVSWGGACTGRATAYNIMKVIANHAHKDDGIILTGDFNAEPSSTRIEELSSRMHKVYSGTKFGGVDHIFSNCEGAVGANLGPGRGFWGSDHDALSATFTFR
mmetsp:Transcript_20111/g.43837  ORF Transcript_20111/g.43837 Transcript_20111/m.43837 type:complete len:350 (+) Transcript_20111:158-1207(+)